MSKQLELDYPAHNFTTTSKDAWSSKKDKLTKREQVYELLKLNALSKMMFSVFLFVILLLRTITSSASKTV